MDTLTKEKYVIIIFKIDYQGTGIKEPHSSFTYAEEIKKEAGIMTAAVGLISSAHQAEEIIKEF